MAITRKDQLLRWDVIGPHTQEALLRLGSPARHKSRVEEVRKVLDSHSYSKEQEQLILLMEEMGVGGHGPWGDGAGTARLPMFECLGSGRCNASDGEVWNAALRAHRQHVTLYPTYNVDTESWCVGVEFLGGDIRVADPDDFVDQSNYCWWHALMGECLLASLSDPPRESRLKEYGENQCRVKGIGRDWCHLYESAAKDAAAYDALWAWVRDPTDINQRIAGNVCLEVAGYKERYGLTDREQADHFFLIWMRENFSDAVPNHFSGLIGENTVLAFDKGTLQRIGATPVVDIIYGPA